MLQVTGHKNVGSLTSYDHELEQAEQVEYSHLLSTTGHGPMSLNPSPKVSTPLYDHQKPYGPTCTITRASQQPQQYDGPKPYGQTSTSIQADQQALPYGHPKPYGPTSTSIQGGPLGGIPGLLSGATLSGCQLSFNIQIPTLPDDTPTVPVPQKRRRIAVIESDSDSN